MKIGEKTIQKLKYLQTYIHVHVQWSDRVEWRSTESTGFLRFDDEVMITQPNNTQSITSKFVNPIQSNPWIYSIHTRYMSSTHHHQIYVWVVWLWTVCSRSSIVVYIAFRTTWPVNWGQPLWLRWYHRKWAAWRARRGRYCGISTSRRSHVTGNVRLWRQSRLYSE